MLHCLLQTVAALALFWLWTLVVFNDFTGSGPVSYRPYLAYSLVIAAGILFDFMRPGTARSDFIDRDYVRSCGISVRQTLTVLTLLLLFLVAAKDLAISRTFLFTYIPSLFCLLIYTNRVLPRFLAGFVFSGGYLQNTILVGSSMEVARLSDWLDRKAHYGIRLVGLVAEEPATDSAIPAPYLGGLADLQQHIARVSATQVIAVGLPRSAEIINGMADICQGLGVRLLIANDFELLLGRRVTMLEEDGITFMGFHKEPLESPVNRILKRGLDLTVAVPVVLIFIPLIALLVWLFHRIQSPGPLFFRQTRTGFQGQDFVIYKFRSMQTENPDPAQQASAGDPRVFPAGRWLRKLSLDELPQFINVLKGEMSVVGPRPHLREHDAIFRNKMNAYGVRGFIKPGITGLAQVRGLRGEIKTDSDVIARVENDLSYLENWSLILDIAIIVRTSWKVLNPPKMAY
ncbi:MAG: exopolysaccharide biosynthesis polyprenyl glycosylphosphotransferase [Verrucomicrobiota bacterium]